MDRLAEVEAALGPVAVMSLERRGLIVPVDVVTSGDASIADRVAGALVGVAVGRSLASAAARAGGAGRLAPRALRRLALTPRVGAAGAPAQTALITAEAWAGRSWHAAAEVSDRVTGDVGQLRSPGRAIVTMAAARHAGAVWFEAAGPSYGDAALPRAIAIGALYGDDPARGVLAAQLDAATTHAHPVATGCAAITAVLVAALVTRPADTGPAQCADAVLVELGRNDGRVGALVADVLATAHSARRPPELWGDATAPSTLGAAVWALLQPDPMEALAELAAEPSVGRSAVAVAGGLVGAALGLDALPRHWTERVELGDELRRAAVGPVPAPRTPTTDPGVASIWFLLDRSGSMASIADDVVGGFDTFIADQRADAGDARLTLVQFDGQDPHQVLVDAAPLDRVRSIAGRFRPRGNTPLFDAVALLLDRAERAGGHDADQLVVIFTDGEENASRTWSRVALFDRIARLQQRGWTFVFLGANQDSYAAGRAIGLAAGNVSNFGADATGVDAAYLGLSRATREWRGKSRQARSHDAQRFWGDVKEAEDEMRKRPPRRRGGAR